MLQEVDQPNFITDVWSATAVILEFLLGVYSFWVVMIIFFKIISCHEIASCAGSHF